MKNKVTAALLALCLTGCADYGITFSVALGPIKFGADLNGGSRPTQYTPPATIAGRPVNTK